jgi:hypothetical protein
MAVATLYNALYLVNAADIPVACSRYIPQNWAKKQNGAKAYLVFHLHGNLHHQRRLLICPRTSPCSNGHNPNSRVAPTPARPLLKWMFSEAGKKHDLEAHKKSNVICISQLPWVLRYDRARNVSHEYLWSDVEGPRPARRKGACVGQLSRLVLVGADSMRLCIWQGTGDLSKTTRYGVRGQQSYGIHQSSTEIVVKFLNYHRSCELMEQRDLLS